MKSTIKRTLSLSALGLIASLLWSVPTLAADGPRSPVGKLLDPAGGVEYSRDGERWRPVTRAKYVFAGYKVRTGADGSTSFVNQSTGLAQTIGADASVEVTESGIQPKAGSVSDPFSAEGGLITSLENKFASAQRYTTVRRAVVKPGEPNCERKIRLPRQITASQEFNDLVWDLACPGDEYRLTVGGESVTVPKSAVGSEKVRYSLPNLAAGDYELSLEVLSDGAVVYSPRRPSKLTILDQAARAALEERLVASGDDLFAKADVLSEQGVLVGALDAQAEYFAAYPDDMDMKPLYIAQLQALRLQTLREAEAIKYNEYLASEGGT